MYTHSREGGDFGLRASISGSSYNSKLKLSDYKPDSNWRKQNRRGKSFAQPLRDRRSNS